MPVCTFLTKVQSYSCKSPYKEQSVADGTPQTHAEDIKGMQAHHKNFIVCTTPNINKKYQISFSVLLNIQSGCI